MNNQPSSFVLALGRLFVLRPLSITTLLLIAAVTFAMGLLASRVSAGETLAIGTESDRVYLTDGFYDPERSAEHGVYRWTQPLAQLTVPDWGPGNLRVSMRGYAASTGQALLKIGGVAVAQADIRPGQAWTLQGWGVVGGRNPTVTLEAPPLNPQGDKRTLGLLVKSLEIYAPDARLRAFLHIALLGLSGAFLFLFLYLRAGNFVIASITGVSVPALLGPLAAYRDLWMGTVAWVAPPLLAVFLLLAWRKEGRRDGDIQVRRSAHVRTLLLVLALTSFLFLLYLGYMNAFDADRMYQVAAGLSEYGRPTRYPGFDTWTKYGFGQPLIAVPFYLLGKLGVLFGGMLNPLTRLTVSFTNLAVTALTCWLLYRASLRFASLTVALTVAATYLLTTPALNYARTFFSEPAGGLLLLTGIILIIPHSPQEPPQPRRILLAGVCLGAMILFKPAFAVYLPAAGIAVLWLAVKGQSQWGIDDRPRASSPFVLDIPRFPFPVLRPLLLFAIGPIIALVIQAMYNYVRYEPLPNALFRTGYEKEPGFSTPLLEGLGGLLLSPGKSIFLYAPVLLLVPLGLWAMYRRPGGYGKLTVTLILAEVAAGLVFNSLWWAWTGNFAWGPRLIIPILPLLIWPLAGVGSFIQSAARPLAGRIITGAWIVLAALGAIVSIPGALVDFQVYYRSYDLALAGDPGESVTIYDPANSPLLVEPGYLLDGLTAAIHRPGLASTGMNPIWDIIVPAGLVALACFCLWYGTLGGKPVGNVECGVLQTNDEEHANTRLRAASIILDQLVKLRELHNLEQRVASLESEKET